METVRTALIIVQLGFSDTFPNRPAGNITTERRNVYLPSNHPGEERNFVIPTHKQEFHGLPSLPGYGQVHTVQGVRETMHLRCPLL